jgi:hypothetical protein
MSLPAPWAAITPVPRTGALPGGSVRTADTETPFDTGTVNLRLSTEPLPAPVMVFHQYRMESREMVY